MTPKQILDSFSETLVRDERILSAQERALVATLLRHAKTATGENQEIQEAVRVVIASAVGETVAQRAFAVLGGSIVERILKGSCSITDFRINRNADFSMDTTPQEPDPPTPAVKPNPSRPRPMDEPDSPGSNPGEPDPPPRKPNTEPDPPVPHGRTTAVLETAI